MPRIKKACHKRARRIDSSDPLFKSDEARYRFSSDFEMRKVIPGKCIMDLEQFRSVGFVEFFEDQHWTPLLTLHHPIYPRLIRLFFANLEIDESHPRVTSFVKGRTITLDPPTLSDILSIPDAGSVSTVSRNWNELPFSPLVQTQTVVDDPTLGLAIRPSARVIPVHHRIAHHIISHSILPRDGHRDHISFLDMFLLTHMILRVPVNLPHIMVWHIIETFRSHGSLPYGLAFTLIFIHFGVDFADEEERLLRSPHDYITATTFRKMRLRLHQGEYVQRRDLDSSESEPEDAAPSSPPPASAPAPAPSPAPAPAPASEPGPSVAADDAPFRSGVRGGYRSLRQEISEMRHDMASMHQQLQQDFSSQISDLRQDYTSQISGLRADFSEMMDYLRQHFP